jgi:Heavy-metal resistance
MRKTLLAAVLAAPLAALAAPPGPAPDRDARREEMRDRMERRMRVARTIQLADALDLDEAQALKLREVVNRFHEKRRPLQQQARDAAETLRKAARGDAAAQKGVDDAIRKLREVRSQIVALNDEMFTAVAKDLPPDKKARAALAMARMRDRMAGQMERFRERIHRFRRDMEPGGPGGMGPRGMGPGFGPGMDPDEMGHGWRGMKGPHFGMGPEGQRLEIQIDGPEVEIVMEDDDLM